MLTFVSLAPLMNLSSDLQGRVQTSKSVCTILQAVFQTEEGNSDCHPQK